MLEFNNKEFLDWIADTKEPLSPEDLKRKFKEIDEGKFLTSVDVKIPSPNLQEYGIFLPLIWGAASATISACKYLSLSPLHPRSNL